MDRCEKCEVPLLVSAGLNWGSNGVISLGNSPRNRMVFFESENIDKLFKGIAELIGVPIEHMVIESRARETKRYIERLYPPDPELREIVARMEKAEAGEGCMPTAEERDRVSAVMNNLMVNIINISRVYGYGDQRPSDGWESGAGFPWRKYTIRKPYSLLFMSADNLGSVEVSDGGSMWVRYEKTGEDTYDVEVYRGEHPVELKERLKRKRYELKPGGISWERCSECGIPLAVAARKWNLDEGTITDPATGRKFSIFGPAAADAIFEDLESELGEAIQEAVIEAQRRYLKTAWGGDRWNRAGETFQHMIALRGLGNMVEFEGDRSHLTLNIENSCLHLPVVGTVQALVELAYRANRSTLEWELSEDGDLKVTVILR